MNILIDNIEGEYASGEMLTFSNYPQLVTVENASDIDKAEMTITFRGHLSLNREQYYININGVSVFGFNDITRVENNTFWFGRSSNNSTNMTMCYTLAKALNNTSLANIYDIYTDRQLNDSGDIETSIVHIVAKESGDRFNITTVETDLPKTSFSYVIDNVSEDSDSIEGSKVICQLYIQPNELEQRASGFNVLPFAEELEKTFVKDSVSFDISPILNNYTKDGNVIQYNVVLSYLKGIRMNNIGQISNIFNISGHYMENGSEFTSNEPMFLQNVSNGTDSEYLNNSKLYYFKDIRYTVYNNTLSPLTATYKYYSYDGTLLRSETKTIAGDKKIKVIDYRVLLGIQEYYIVISIENIGNIRYDRIKPLRYGDDANYINVFFTNSMGGKSFVPFTANIEEEFDVDSLTYNRNVIDHYNASEFNVEKTYSTTTDTTLTLKSHIMPKDGLYAYRDMLRSKFIAIEQYGKDFSLKVEDYSEEQLQKGLYQVSVSFKYKV